MRMLSLALIGLAVALAPVLVVAGLLNLRDRREARLQGLVVRAFPPRVLRSDLGLGIRSAVLSRRSVVDLYPGDWAADEVRDAVSRLRRALPPYARLRVDGQLAPDWRGRLTIDALAEVRRA